MSPPRGLGAFGLSISEPIPFINTFTNTYGQPPWKALFSPNDALKGVQYDAHYLLDNKVG